MNAEKINVYDACDKAISAMNRENLEAFGRLKMEKTVNIRTVMAVYRTSRKRAKKRYYEIGFEAYLLAMAMCRIPAKKAHEMAEKAIDEQWVDKVLSETDLVTLYRFDTEMERKAYRLAETLEATRDRDFEINKALRFWSQQVSQYAINVTDYAMVEAFQDAGVEEITWHSRHDGRVCNECHAYDGQVFVLDELPLKHYGCRCWLTPVLKD